jgi:hypothetical protein
MIVLIILWPVLKPPPLKPDSMPAYGADRALFRKNTPYSLKKLFACSPTAAVLHQRCLRCATAGIITASVPDRLAAYGDNDSRPGQRTSSGRLVLVMIVCIIWHGPSHNGILHQCVLRRWPL